MKHLMKYESFNACVIVLLFATASAAADFAIWVMYG
jgi:hypothetical protein